MASVRLQCTEYFCEKCVLAENEGIDFGQEILFRMRDERGEFKLFNEMYEHDHESFHHNFQLVLPSLIVLLSKVGQATAAKRGDSRSVHELSLAGETTPYDWSNLTLFA